MLLIAASGTNSNFLVDFSQKFGIIPPSPSGTAYRPEGQGRGASGSGQKRLNIFNLVADFALLFIQPMRTKAEIFCAESKLQSK
jgi:hypothetical protein